MKITIDKSKCIAAGQCVLKAPAVFDQNEDDGIVVLITDSPTAEAEQAVRLAARVCPAEAITIDE